MADRRLHLFSSNATDLYLQDAINSLSQPQGSIIHYRYDEKYVAAALRTVTEAELLNLPVLLNLFDHRYLSQPALALTPGQVIFPLRHGTVVGFERGDSVLHFWVRLGEHVQVETPGGYQRLVDEVVRRLGTELPTSTPGCFAALGDGSVLPQEPPGHQFRTIVNAITQECLDADRMAFLQVAGVQRIDRGTVRAEPQVRTSQVMAKGLPSLSRYLWKPETTYVIGISWYAPHKVAPVGGDHRSLVLSIEHDDTQVVLAGPSLLRMTGRYDKDYLYITPRVPNKSVQTNLTLRVVQQDGLQPPSIPKNGAVLGLNYTIPILIDAGEGRYKRLTAWGDGAVALGVFLVVLAGLLAKPATSSAAAKVAVAAQTWQAWLAADFHWLLILAGLFTLCGGIGKAYATSKL